MQTIFTKREIGTKCIVILFLFLFSNAYSTKTVPKNPPTSKVDGNELISLASDEFNAFTQRVYNEITYTSGQDSLSLEALSSALKGYLFLKHTQELSDTQYLTVIDFSKHCNTKRLWVIDLINKNIKINEWVAHGNRSGNEYANSFSNQHSSKKSSLGFYVTGNPYYGRNNLSLKLHGLEPNFNSNAFSRGVVIHGADYISPTIVNRNERIGRSFGCPAVSKSINKTLINTIKEGTCLFIYYPNQSYMNNSRILNTSMYLTINDLVI